MGLMRATPPSPPCLQGGWGEGNWVAMALAATLLAGCSGQMADQPSFKSQEAPLLPASGSLPMTPVRPWAAPFPPNAATPSNPLSPTPSLLEVGALRYRDNCSFCHGQGGKGDGPVGEVYAPRPRDLTDAHVRAMSDGDLYVRITNGFSTMPSFRKRLSPQDRWAIVMYVRQLEKKAPVSGP